jgi:aspartyl-tRNA(Asn)/glutamyl-tRNA(Gln) amidotransferase subunit B
MSSSAQAPSLHQKLATPEEIGKYEAVIGLEVHVQLNTLTKIFCGCPTGFGAPPNSNVCSICLGLPGALPMLNRRTVEMAIQAALATHCLVNAFSRFARKNYFYPDLPKGYQISQYDQPLAEHGWLDANAEGAKKRIGITRIHLEDDAGKSIHDGFKDSDRYTYVDLNRSGTPLIEIVSEPDIRSSDEAHAYLTELKQIMQYVGVSECDMEKGQLRCDANVSVRLKGADKFGTKVEVKNLNSFRFAKMAMDYEIARQVAVVEGGGRIEQESRLYNVATGETVGMRSKEHAHDYRYFPEPDLVPLRVSEAWLEEIKSSVPKLPAEKREEFLQQGLSDYQVQVVTASRPWSEHYEKAAAISGDFVATANFVTSELMAMPDALERIKPEGTGTLVSKIKAGEISGKMAKHILEKMYETGESPDAIIDREGLRQISDTGALEKIVDEVLAASPKQVEQYKAGKTTVIGYLVGQVMKASKGQANPAAVNELLKGKLS